MLYIKVNLGTCGKERPLIHKTHFKLQRVYTIAVSFRISYTN